MGEQIAIARELAAHFDRGDGPVMIGGTEDNRSRACVGVCLAQPTHAPTGGSSHDTSNCRGAAAWLLVIDPHFSGTLEASAADASNVLTADGAAALGRYFAWEPMDSLSDGWHNLCCPSPSLGPDDSARNKDTSVAQEASLDDDMHGCCDIVVQSAGFDGVG